MAFGTTEGVRVVDVATGKDTTTPWPREIRGPWDTVPPVRWLGQDLVVLHWQQTWILRGDGTFEKWAHQAAYGNTLALSPDGTAYFKDYETKQLFTWTGDDTVRSVPFRWWGERFATGFGQVVFVGGSMNETNGPMVVDPDSGEVLAYAPIKDPNTVYSDNGTWGPSASSTGTGAAQGRAGGLPHHGPRRGRVAPDRLELPHR